MVTNVSDGTDYFNVSSRTSTQNASKQNNLLLDATFVVVLVVSCLIFYFIATNGTWSPLFHEISIYDTGRFFLAQAQATTHGRLWVSPSRLPGECFLYNGRCYGYFGVTPSLIRLPFLPLLNHYKSGFTPVFLTAGLTLATGSFLASLRHLLSSMHLSRSAKFLIALIAVTFGAGSVLVTLTPANVYDEAIAWAVGFLSLAVFCFIRWWEIQQLRWYFLLLASLVLATNARPTAVPFALVIGLGVGYRLWSLNRAGPADWGMSILLAGVMIILPIATCLGVFLIKFGAPIPSYLLDQEISGPHAVAWWIKIRQLDHDHLQSLRFLPTTLFASLRPDSLGFSQTFPWLALHFGGSTPGSAPITYIDLAPGSLYVGPMTSLTATMPLSFLTAIGAAAYRLQGRATGGRQRLLRSHPLRAWAWWQIIVLVAAVSAWCVTLTSVTVTNRFLGMRIQW